MSREGGGDMLRGREGDDMSREGGRYDDMVGWWRVEMICCVC